MRDWRRWCTLERSATASCGADLSIPYLASGNVVFRRDLKVIVVHISAVLSAPEPLRFKSANRIFFANARQAPDRGLNQARREKMLCLKQYEQRSQGAII